MRARRRNPDGASVVGTLAVIGAIGLGAWALFFRRPAQVYHRQSLPAGTPTSEQASQIEWVAVQQYLALGLPLEPFYNNPAPIPANLSTAERNHIAARRAIGAFLNEREGLENLDREYAIRFGLPPATYPR